MGSRKARRVLLTGLSTCAPSATLIDSDVADFTATKESIMNRIPATTRVAHETSAPFAQGSGAIGSFYPLAGDDASAPSALFAYVVDTAEQRRALHEEAMARLAAVASFSEAMLTMPIDDHDKWSHARVMAAIAILSRDAKGLIEAAELAVA